MNLKFKHKNTIPKHTNLYFGQSDLCILCYFLLYSNLKISKKYFKRFLIDTLRRQEKKTVGGILCETCCCTSSILEFSK